MILSEYIHKYVSDLGKVVVAVSGGVDSIVLLHAIHTECNAEIHVVHVDHQLRPESGAEASFVKAFCDKRNISCSLEKIKVNPDTSLQVTARTQRHAVLRRSAARLGTPYILTAHHLDDYAETLMMNIARGGGINSLAFGFEKRHAPFIYLRPLFQTSREKIEAFAAEHNLEWREDPSNQKSDYLRNRLRKNLLELREVYGQGLAQSASRIYHAAEILTDTNNNLWENSALNEGPFHIRFATEELPKKKGHLSEFIRHLSKEKFGESLSEKSVEQCLKLILSQRKGSASLRGIQVELDDELSFRKNFGQGEKWWTEVQKNCVLRLHDSKAVYQWFDWEISISEKSSLHPFLAAGKKIEIRNWKRGMTRDGKPLSKLVKKHTKNERWKIPCLFIEEEPVWILGDENDESNLGIHVERKTSDFSRLDSRLAGRLHKP